MESYAIFWHTLLWLEEVAQSLMLLKYNMAEVTATLKKDKLEFEVPGLGEKRPSVIVGDYIRVKASSDENPIAYKGQVTRVTNDTVEISFIAHRYVTLYIFLFLLVAKTTANIVLSLSGVFR